MIYVHPTQLHTPLQVAALELRTGMRMETRGGRAVLVARRGEHAQQPAYLRTPRIDWTSGGMDPKGAA